ncbi:hypothetical protein [Peribacillus asahii]|uniref:Ger(x)C family spore germination protein n=1 Tax=Peribacillus asahii TaxID=228899 RepID=UPI00382A2D12
MVLFDKHFAKKGVAEALISLSKDPTAGSRMQIDIADPSAQEILTSSEKVQLPFHISEKINHNIEKGNLPKMNLNVLLNHFYTEGRDGYLPYIIIKERSIEDLRFSFVKTWAVCP